MKRRLAAMSVVLVVGLLLAALVFLVVRGPGRAPERWQTALETYLAHKDETAGETWVLAATQQATAPSVFDVSTSSATYGRGVYYRTDATYIRETPTPGVFGLSPRMSRRPVPYPPTEVWCAVLDPGQGGSGPSHVASRVIFVALHQDLYNAAWIVHETEELPLSRDLMADLAELGCVSIVERN
jgi:hypothetical protein